MDFFSCSVALVKEKPEGRIEAGKGAMSAEDVAAGMGADLWQIINKYPGGDVSMITPEGEVRGPFDAGGAITGPWGIAIDGNDPVWVANSTSSSVTQLAGARTIVVFLGVGGPVKTPLIGPVRIPEASAWKNGGIDRQAGEMRWLWGNQKA